MCGKKVIVKYEKSIKLDQNLKIKLQISNEFGYINNVKVLLNKNGERPGGSGIFDFEYNQNESTDLTSVFDAEIELLEPGYRTFYIELEINGILKNIKYSTEFDDAIIVNENENYDFWQVFAYLPEFDTPDWIKGGIMYQIFVDTFASKNLPERLKDKVVNWNTFPKWVPDSDGEYRNDQFYGGNIRGIIDHLLYLKTLNVTVLYLTPIFKSKSSNRYDILDYEEIDELVGTWSDLAELHEKANKLGIHLIIDCVFNHSSNENQLFLDYPEAYDWEENHQKPKCWWNYKHLVEFNKNSDIYKENLARWLKKYEEYVDGIRLDVADCLPDHTLKFIRENFHKYILGEVWKNAITGDYRGFFYGDELDGVMNYQYANAIYRYIRWGNVENFKRIVNGIYELYPPQGLDVSPIFLSSHDIPRIKNILVGEFMKESPDYENVWDMEQDNCWKTNGEFDTLKFRKWEVKNMKIPAEKEELATNLMKISVFLQYTLPGLPSIFAGDEIGCVGFKDPTNRMPFPWDNIDYDLYNFYQKIGKFRNDNIEVFSNHDFKIISIDNEKLIYERGRYIFIVNRTNEMLSISEIESSNIIFSVNENNELNCIGPYGAIVIEKI